MKLDQVDWSVLRGALLLLIVSLAISGGLLWSSYYFFGEMNSKYKREQSTLLAIRAQYQNIDEEQNIIEQFLPVYRELESAGIIGQERRLDWIDTLRQASQRVDLPQLRYVIDSQRIYTPEFPLPGGTFRIFSSEMRLDLGLLHEGDLSALFEDLDQNAMGLYTVSSCNMRRAHAPFVKRPDATNLDADCTLRWLTVKQSQGTSS